jgi:hypothetical protein
MRLPKHGLHAARGLRRLLSASPIKQLANETIDRLRSVGERNVPEAIAATQHATAAYSLDLPVVIGSAVSAGFADGHIGLTVSDAGKMEGPQARGAHPARPRMGRAVPAV